MAEKLRPGWKRVKFGDVVRLVTDRCDPVAEGVERYVGLEHLEPGDPRIRSWGAVADGTTFTNRFRAGQVLFGKRRAYQRKVAVADFDGVCSGDIYVFESADPTRLLPELLLLVCQTGSFFEYAVGTSAGSLSPRTTWTSLASYEFVLPPPSVQRQIANGWDAALQTRESYRVAIANTVILLDGLVDHQLGRCSVSHSVDWFVGEGIIAPPQDGNHGEKHPKASDYVVSGVPFLMASDVREGEIRFDTCKRIPEELASSLRIGFAQVGDVLLTHKGTVGEVALLSRLPTNCTYAMLTPQVTYYRVMDSARLCSRFLMYVFRSRGFQRQLRVHGQQSTRAYVGITTQRSLVLPLPTASAQEELVLAADKLENARKEIAERLANVVRVQNAILAKLSAGEDWNV